MNEMPLPTRVEGVTGEWLTRALNVRFPGVKVTAAEIADVLWGTSTKLRVRLAYNARGEAYGLPATMIVKGGFEQHSPSMKYMYSREARFYRDLQPCVSLPSPRCYYAGIDPGADAWQAIVIMEDMRQPGVVFCDPLRPQSYEQVARRLEAMARYHAQMWEHPEFRPGGRFDWVDPNLAPPTLEYCARYLEPGVWQHYIALPRGAAVSVRLHDREWMRQALHRLADFHQWFPCTLVEGDTHLGNLYLYPDGSPGFLDMQVMHAPWFHDVTYHLICALDIADRRQWEKPLLRHYLRCLGDHGLENPPDFDEAFECYRRDIVWGLFIFLINEVRFQTEAVNTAYAARFGDAAIAHDTVRLMS